MTYDPYEGIYQYLDEQLGFGQQFSGHRPAQKLPQRDSITASQARRQEEIEARARQRNFQGALRMTPDAYPNVRQRPASREDDEVYGDDDLYTRPPRSAVRYQPEFEEVYQQGNTHLYAGRIVIPKKRRSAQPQQLPPGRTGQAKQESYADDRDEHEAERVRPRRRPKTRINALVWLGLGMIMMIFLWIGFSNLLNWWQMHQDDSAYGRPRTFQIDAVVGHNDSSGNPSHFTAINLDRHVIVIEIPGRDPTKARIYPITTLFGDGQELTPVTLSFKDVTGNGLPDMEIHIRDQTIVMVNENGQFRPLKPGEKVQL